MLRQEQFRLVIAPLVGPAALVLFMTTRTIANVVVAGLGTIAIPLTPELARYLSVRDAARSASVMSLVWLVLVGGSGARCGGSAVFHRAGVHGVDTRPGTVRRRVVCPIFSRRAAVRFRPTDDVRSAEPQQSDAPGGCLRGGDDGRVDGNLHSSACHGCPRSSGLLTGGRAHRVWVHRGRPAKDVRVTRHGVAAQTGAHHGGEPRGLVSAHRFGIATRNPRQLHCSGGDHGRHRRLGRTPCVVAGHHPSDGETLAKASALKSVAAMAFSSHLRPCRFFQGCGAPAAGTRR